MLFLGLPIINLLTNRIKTEMHFKLSNLNSDLVLTLGYLDPAFNNSALKYKGRGEGGGVGCQPPS